MKKRFEGSADLAFQIVNYIILLIFVFLCIYPFYYIFIYSISDPVLAQKGIMFFPIGITLKNYGEIFKLDGLAGAAVISVMRTVIGTIITVVCCSLFAYLVTKEELYFRKIIYRFAVITMYFNAGLIPLYLTIKAYHLNNNFLVYVLPFAISAYYVVLIKTFIEQIPPALEESARIDGAGYFTTYVKIIFPLSKPIIATIAVFAAVMQWNSWFDNYIFVQNNALNTLQLTLYNYLNQANYLASQAMNTSQIHSTDVMKTTPETIRMTITMVVTLPIIFVYPFLQRYFTKGIMLGAVKG